MGTLEGCDLSGFGGGQPGDGVDPGRAQCFRLRTDACRDLVSRVGVLAPFSASWASWEWRSWCSVQPSSPASCSGSAPGLASGRVSCLNSQRLTPVEGPDGAEQPDLELLDLPTVELRLRHGQSRVARSGGGPAGHVRHTPCGQPSAL